MKNIRSTRRGSKERVKDVNTKRTTGTHEETIASMNMEKAKENPSIMAIGDNNRRIPKEKDIPKIQLKAKAKAKAERKEKENMEAKRAKGKVKVEEKVNRSQDIGRNTTKKKRQ